MQAIIETLNMINGIVFIHVKPNSAASPPPQLEKLSIEDKSAQTTTQTLKPVENGPEKADSAGDAKANVVVDQIDSLLTLD